MHLELEILNYCSSCDRTCGEDECLYRESKRDDNIVQIPREGEFQSVAKGAFAFMTGYETYLRDDLKGLEKIEAILKEKIAVL